MHNSYFSRPYEAFCKENLSFILKSLGSLLFTSGLSSLMEDMVIHNSIYKHLTLKYTNIEGALKLDISISYALSHNDKKSSLVGILGLKKDQYLTKCLICSSSQINMIHSDY